MNGRARKFSLTLTPNEKQPVYLISPQGFFPPWATRGVLFLDTNITDKLVSGSTRNASAWSTGWLSGHTDDYLLSPLLWAYEQSYRREDPVEYFSECVAKASAAFRKQGYATFSSSHLAQTFETLDSIIKPTEHQLAWLEYCVAAKLGNTKAGKKVAVVAAANYARDNFEGKNIGIALFVGLLVVAGHHASWRLIKGAPAYTRKAARNALLDLNIYLAYLLLRDILAQTYRSAPKDLFSVWFATADKPLAHVMLNGRLSANFTDEGARVHFTLGSILKKGLRPDGVAGFEEALRFLDAS